MRPIDDNRLVTILKIVFIIPFISFLRFKPNRFHPCVFSLIIIDRMGRYFQYENLLLVTFVNFYRNRILNDDSKIGTTVKGFKVNAF